MSAPFGRALAVPLAAVALASGAGCLRSRPTLVPMPVVSLPTARPAASTSVPAGAADGGNPSCLVIFLPGIRDVPEDFERHRFVELARNQGVACEFEAADAHIGYFAERQVVERLRTDVIAPAHARGYRDVWLAGVSLGGLASILYTQRHPEDVAGLILIAPYLGPPRSVNDLRQLARARAPVTPVPSDTSGARRAALVTAWAWLGGYEDPAANRPPLYLVYGTADRYAPLHRALGEILPDGHVIAGSGGHDWATWTQLWAAFLATRTLPQRP